MMKLHGQFTEEAKKAIDDRLPSIKDEIRHGLLTDIMHLSRMGLCPEGWSPNDGPVPIPPPTILPAEPDPSKPATATIGMSGFKLSRTSLNKLVGVHSHLAACVKLAIGYSLVDFGVGQGARTIEEQRDAFRRGTTRTMKSKHLPNAKGIVMAVDLWAYVDGKVSWDFDHYYYIALAMDRAATELGVANHIRWGCVWDRVRSDFGIQGVATANHYGDIKARTRAIYLDAIEAYKKRHAGSDFLDGPHFEWVE